MKFRVKALITETKVCYVEVEADSKEEALIIADEYTIADDFVHEESEEDTVEVDILEAEEIDE